MPFADRFKGKGKGVRSSPSAKDAADASPLLSPSQPRSEAPLAKLRPGEERPQRSRPAAKSTFDPTFETGHFRDRIESTVRRKIEESEAFRAPNARVGSDGKIGTSNGEPWYQLCKAMRKVWLKRLGHCAPETFRVPSAHAKSLVDGVPQEWRLGHHGTISFGNDQRNVRKRAHMERAKYLHLGLHGFELPSFERSDAVMGTAERSAAMTEAMTEADGLTTTQIGALKDALELSTAFHSLPPPSC